jgi:hypothetical protein
MYSDLVLVWRIRRFAVKQIQRDSRQICRHNSNSLYTVAGRGYAADTPSECPTTLIRTRHDGTATLFSSLLALRRPWHPNFLGAPVFALYYSYLDTVICLMIPSNSSSVVKRNPSPSSCSSSPPTFEAMTFFPNSFALATILDDQISR